MTATAYKYLDIGISVGPISYVEMILGDNKGNQIILSYATWKTFMEQRANVEQFVQSTVSSRLSVRDLIIELVKIRDEDIVKLMLCDNYMYIKPSTLLFLFEIEDCVDYVCHQMHQNTFSVSDKYKQFITIIRQNHITNKSDAAKLLREKYDKTCLVECELIAYALDNIVYNALYDK